MLSPPPYNSVNAGTVNLAEKEGRVNNSDFQENERKGGKFELNGGREDTRIRGGPREKKEKRPTKNGSFSKREGGYSKAG